MNKLKVFLLLLIITIPSFISLLNNNYFPMHDDQHIARLYLLDQGIRQGSIYPRWVDTLGFNLGYPLFNFYPPLIYYTAEIFHLFGFSLIWSIKLMVITGLLLGALGIYLLTKKVTNTWPAVLSTVLYTFFSYHAVLVYVRGAFAEFFAMSILPFVLLATINLSKKIDRKNSTLLGISFALLILAHPLIALPSLFFIGAFFIYYFATTQEKIKYAIHFILGSIFGLLLSAFFWLPSMVERKYTLIDEILTRELASYKVHYVYPGQFLYSPWGFGGSLPGPIDGMSFQLGKVHIILAISSLILFLFFAILLVRSKRKNPDGFFLLVLFLSVFSLFLTTDYASLIWDNISYLWYLQFPWRFLTFAGIFMAITGGYFIYFLNKTINKNFKVMIVSTIILSLITAGIYQKYFKPSRYIATTDKELTSFDEIAWRVSRTSFEFIPKGVKTTKSDLNTTIPAIDKDHVVRVPYEIVEGTADVKQTENNDNKKSFNVTSEVPIKFRLNTYNFPGWAAYLDNQKVPINDLDDFKRITIQIPSGNHTARFTFQNTPVRTVGDVISIISFILLPSILLIKRKHVS